jgi:ABC-type multidrug transport system fused ATPase/permease subunit
MIDKVNTFYTLIFVVLFIIFFIISAYFNYKMIPLRKKRYEHRNSRLKYVVKILMNKQEIMQSAKIDKETDEIYRYSEKLAQLNKDM